MAQNYVGPPHTSTLADVLDRILDKGVVIAGDIKVLVADVELLTIQIRLLIASVDKAMEIGVNWWQTDPHLNGQAQKLIESNQMLQEQVNTLQRTIAHEADKTVEAADET